MRTRSERSAGGVVYRRTNEVVEVALASRRTRRGDLAWGLAKGLIEPGQMVVTITRDGFIKRTTLETFRAQNRGGRGRSGAGMRGDVKAEERTTTPSAAAAVASTTSRRARRTPPA